MVGILDLLFPPDDLSRGKAGSPTGSAEKLLKLAKMTPGGGAPFMPTNPPLPTSRPDIAQPALQEAPAVDPMQTASTGPSPADPNLGWQRGLGSSEGSGRGTAAGRGTSGGGSGLNWRELLRALGPALMMADPLGRNQGMAAAMMRRNDQRREDAQTAQNQNATKQWLLTQGLDEGTASMMVQDPTMLRQWFGERDKKPDPKEALEIEKLRLDIDQKRNPTTNDMIEYDAARKQGYKGSLADWVKDSKAGVTVNMPGGNNSKFIEEADKAASGRLNDIITAGNDATTFLGDIRALGDLGRQIGTGKEAQVKAALGPYAAALGFEIENLGETQAFDAIVARLAPQMRPAGSGAASDFDARQFVKSLPSLGNTQDGNEILTATFEALQQHRIAAAEIASKAFDAPEEGGITWQEAEKQIRALPNPYERFKQWQKGKAKVVGGYTIEEIPD